MQSAILALICLGTIALGLALAIRAPKHPSGVTYPLIAFAILIALIALVSSLGIPLEVPPLPWSDA